MKKVFAVENIRLKAMAEGLGFRCELITSESQTFKDALVIRIRRQSDFAYFEPLRVALEGKARLIYIVFNPVAPSEVSECCRGYYVKSARLPVLSIKEKNFLEVLMKNDQAKGVCIDLGITRATYASYKKNLLFRLNLKTVDELRLWAVINLRGSEA
ncbi:MAG: hypothetical protein ACI4NM_05510 [Bullifex sp.]